MIMNQLTSNLREVTVYLNDLLIGGVNAQEHLQSLLALLQQIQEKGLRCHLSKCAFARLSVEYLECTLTCDGVSKEQKEDALTRMLPPSKVMTIRSFLCSVRLNGKFIPNLPTLTEPLNH